MSAAALKGCAASCDRMGICQALADCQDKPHIDAQLAKTAPVGQSHAHSWLESATNVAIGFLVSLVITAIVLPAFGHNVTLAENVAMTSIFTVASLIRGYFVRRFFIRIFKS